MTGIALTQLLNRLSGKVTTMITVNKHSRGTYIMVEEGDIIPRVHYTSISNDKEEIFVNGYIVGETTVNGYIIETVTPTIVITFCAKRIRNELLVSMLVNMFKAILAR